MYNFTTLSKYQVFFNLERLSIIELRISFINLEKDCYNGLGQHSDIDRTLAVILNFQACDNIYTSRLGAKNIDSVEFILAKGRNW